MQRLMGASAEGHSGSPIVPRAGDLMLLLVHETFHLNAGGSYSRSNPHDTDAQKALFDRRELDAFFEMDPVKYPAPMYLTRFRKQGGFTPPPGGE